MVTLTKDGNTVRITLSTGIVVWQSIDTFMNGFTLDKATMKVSFTTPKISKTGIPIAQININGVSGITTEEDLGDAIKDLVEMDGTGGGGGISDVTAGYLIDVEQDGDERIVSVDEGSNEVPVPNAFGVDWETGDGWTVTGGGVSARFEGGVVGGLVSLTISDGGSGYSVDDILDIPGGSPGGGQLRVTTVDGGGAVTGLSVETVGEGYSYLSDDIIEPTGGDGTGLKIYFPAFTNIKLKYPDTGQMVAGGKYHLKFTLAKESGGNFVYQIGDSGNVAIASGDVDVYLNYLPFGDPASYGKIYFNPDANFVGTVSAVSLKRVVDVDALEYPSIQKVLEQGGNDADGIELKGLVQPSKLDSAVTFDQVAKYLHHPGYGDFSGGNWTLGEGWSLNEFNQLVYDGTGVAGKLVTFEVVNGGTTYAPGDLISVDVDGTGATFTVDTVDGGGAITGGTITSPGSGYSVSVTERSTTALTGGGSGATVKITEVTHKSAYYSTDVVVDFTKLKLYIKSTGDGNWQTKYGGTNGGFGGASGTATSEFIESSEFQLDGSDLNYHLTNFYSGTIQIVPGNDEPFVLKQWKCFQIPQTDRFINARNVLGPFTSLKFAIINQAGTGVPTESGLGESQLNLALTRSDVGVYNGYKKHAFSGSSCIIPNISFTDAGAGDTNMIKVSRVDDDNLKIETFSDDHVTPADDVLINFSLLILNFND